MSKMKSNVYVLTDTQNRIIRCDGGYSMSNIKNAAEWTLIDEGTGDRYNLCQNNYFYGGLRTMDGIPRWKLVEDAESPYGVKPVLRSDAEIEADRMAKPTAGLNAQELLEAQVAYTAMMTDTLLEV